MTNPLLIVTAGLRKGTQLEIDSKGIRIGRDPDNELFLDDPEVSRHHARVILHNGNVWVQDAGSRNGIFVNGNRVSGHKQISPGAEIQIGTHEFLVQLPSIAQDSSISVDLGSISGGKATVSSGPPKKMILIGAIVCVTLIGAMIVFGGGKSSSNTSNSGDLTENLDNDELSSDRRKRQERKYSRVPDPPANSTPDQLKEQAFQEASNGFLLEAILKYKQCLKLDPEKTACERDLSEVEQKLQRKIAIENKKCIQRRQAKQWEAAQIACERVLSLERNENAEAHKSAKKALDEIRTKL